MRQSRLLSSAIEAIGETPVVELARADAWGRWSDPRQAGVPQPRLLQEGPHCAADHRGRRSAGPAGAGPDRGGADQRQHRDRSRDRVRDQGLSLRRRDVARQLDGAGAHDVRARRRGRPGGSVARLHPRPGVGRRPGAGRGGRTADHGRAGRVSGRSVPPARATSAHTTCTPGRSSSASPAAGSTPSATSPARAARSPGAPRRSRSTIPPSGVSWSSRRARRCWPASRLSTPTIGFRAAGMPCPICRCSGPGMWTAT